MPDEEEPAVVPDEPVVEEPPVEDAPAEEPPAEEPPAEEPPAEEPPAEEPPANDPPAEDPPVEEPPAEDEEDETAEFRDELEKSFGGDKLTGQARATANRFATLAKHVGEALPNSHERTVALRKLFKARNAVIRAMADA